MNTNLTTKSKLDELLKKSPISTNAYSPEKLVITSQNDLLRFTELLNVPGITVVDQIQQQLKEFLKLSQPAKRLSDQELESLAVEHVGQTPLWQYGCWFYYPWSNRLVHLLDEAEFVAVRTSRNQYKITPEEREILAGKKIGVVGLSVGQSVSVTLAMERICGELRLADFDLLELTNLNRIRTGTQNLGLLKAHSVAREIAELDPYLKVVCFTDGLTEENMDEFFCSGGKLDLLVEESDGFDIKVLARYKARELQVPVIMEASDRCMVDVERFDLEPNRPILHGILDHLDVATLKSLKSNEEKIPYMFDILGLKSTSAKLKASMLEMQQTITTWPQLASAVTMGGGITADVSRRLLLNDFKSSGRYYVDIDELIGDKPEAPYVNQQINLQHYSPEIENNFDAELNSDITDLHLDQIIDAMILAPSFGNQQAWQYRISSSCIELYYPQENNLKNTDVDNVQLNISIGNVIENAKQKAAQLGYQTTVATAQTAAFNTLVAKLAFAKTNNTVPNFADSISKLATNRSFGTAAQINHDVLNKVVSIQLSDDLKIHLVTKREDIDKLAQALAMAERINLLHSARHYDFYNHVYKAETSSHDIGISVSNLALPPAMKIAYSVLESPYVAMALAKWQKGTAFESYHKSLIASSSALVFVSSSKNNFAAHISTGQSVSNMWFTAVNNSLAFHPICVSLTLLMQMKANSTSANSLSASALKELQKLESSLSEVLKIDQSRSLLFAARVFLPTTTDFPDSKRKSKQEFLFKSQQFAI